MVDKKLSAEELLEKIFYYMTRLFEEKEFSNTVALLTDLGSTIVNGDRASFWFWDKKNKKYWTLAAMGNDRITIPEGSGIVGNCISNNKIIVNNNPYECELFNNKVDVETGYVTKSIICIPVTDVNEQVLGAFQVLNKCDEDGEDMAFDETDVKRLSLVAVFCEKTLESYLLYNEAQIDQLTGLKNRYAFYEFYDRKVLPNLNDRHISVVMCDIDHFKLVNDTYGHNAGDIILKNVAEIFKNAIGEHDEIVRWGGEEFIFILDDKDCSEAGEFAENVRKTVESSTHESNGNVIKVTMSFGVNEISRDCSLEDNVKFADDKLYIAKNTGRNKVEM